MDIVIYVPGILYNFYCLLCGYRAASRQSTEWYSAVCMYPWVAADFWVTTERDSSWILIRFGLSHLQRASINKLRVGNNMFYCISRCGCGYSCNARTCTVLRTLTVLYRCTLYPVYPLWIIPNNWLVKLTIVFKHLLVDLRILNFEIKIGN